MSEQDKRDLIRYVGSSPVADLTAALIALLWPNGPPADMA